MRLISSQNRLVVQKYLEDVLKVAWRALMQLYPDRHLVAEDGQRRLFLLYIPDRQGKKSAVVRSTFPVPYGSAPYEWRYIEGEVAGLNWEEFANNNEGAEFPPRTPPFPVKRWPRLRPKLYKDYPRIFIKEFPYISLSDYDESIATAVWMLFINDIPYGLWADVIITLMEHDVRLKRIAQIMKDVEEVKQTRAGMLSRKRGFAYLHSLSKLLPCADVEEGSKLGEYAARIAHVVNYNTFFTHSTFEKHLDELERKLESKWTEFQGPKKKYSKDASRLLKPIVRGLLQTLNTGLDEELQTGVDDERLWVQDEQETFEGARVNEHHLYRLVGDLVRFFYRWNNYKFVGSIAPPAWRGDQAWVGRIGVDEGQLSESGRQQRLNFGKRIRLIHKGKPDRPD